ncbi:hypothetical protein SCLCIDRAFT_1214906 [Scleroderma citrinum Foug A]|uniref:Pre-mRNA-splicing factor 18 n=1 Tax=Scleroderma citrinum Foug A TaxID=1036808 RepID=A0A0C3E425_9AGAM|nr:hypothetical protein SCLCIDRAFT_1214906 [Scleroderma citrinum Foug A]
MDALKAEIAVKRKAVEGDRSSRPTKYLRRGELERLKEEEERKAREEKERVAREEAQRQAEMSSMRRKEKSKSVTPLQEYQESDATKPESSFNISNEETIRRLRAKGQPIRLFGEADKDRRLRLRALELLEEKDHERESGQNDFKKALEDVENVERELRNKNKEKKRGDTDSESGGMIDMGLVKTDPDKLYPLIYYALKRTLKEWEESMDERPEHVKQSMPGKLAAATQVQSADYLKPLFKMLRSRSLPSDMLTRIAEIVHYMQKREYQKANDSYLRLSIGNAPWPIGVTMVGIHERSAREKISSDQVAHVLNDEVSRKYIQSLKRLLTFAQTKYPPEDVSQLMG